MLDPTLTMTPHVNSVTRSAYFQIRNLSKIRKFLSHEATVSLTHAFVSSRLDNMNSLLYDVSDFQIKRIQSLQNQAARIITKEKKSAHITPTLKDLHWLPIKFRIMFKILLTVYKCIHGEGPTYLASLLEEYHPPRALRSAARSLLREPHVHKKYGDRAFSVAGPKLWNELPLEIRNRKSVNIFKKQLKTYLFKKAFNV